MSDDIQELNPCLYCGGIMHLRFNDDGQYWLDCQNCLAASPRVETIERAITLHNQTAAGIDSLRDMVSKTHYVTMNILKDHLNSIKQ